jgi:hypothetical protein
MKIESSAAMRGLHALEADILAAARQAIGQAAALAAAHARATKTFKDRRERGLRSTISRGHHSPWAHFVSIGKGTRHAIWIEDGTEAHEILPRRRKFLRFVQNGRVRFAKRVFHPGTKPTKFVQAARDVGETAAVRFVTLGIDNAIRR